MVFGIINNVYILEFFMNFFSVDISVMGLCGKVEIDCIKILFFLDMEDLINDYWGFVIFWK